VPSDGAEQTRLRALNTEISSLRTRFKHNVLKATADGAVAVDDLKDLDGLSEGQIGAAAQAAAARGLTGSGSSHCRTPPTSRCWGSSRTVRCANAFTTPRSAGHRVGRRTTPR